MKALLTYSGKGGVGKTTVTYCLYETYKAMGYRVAVLDMDLNTPSFHLLANDENVISNHDHAGLFANEAQINLFIGHAFKRIEEINPDVLLIDTPPSITSVHFSLLNKFDVSGVILVSQPTELSRSDVERTVPFFEAKDVSVLGIVENMVEGEGLTYRYPKLIQLPKEEGLSSFKVFENNTQPLEKLCTSLLEMNLKEVSNQNKKRMLFDESLSWPDVKNILGIHEYESGEFHFFNSAKKSLDQIKFINLATYAKVHEAYMNFHDRAHDCWARNHMTEATFDRVERLVKAFEYDDVAEFIITKVVNSGDVIVGEIGSGTLLIDDKFNELPTLNYNTKNGSVRLFPHEVMPVDKRIKEEAIKDGYTYIENGNRFLPPLAVAEEIGSMFNVDLSEKWHRISSGA